MVTLDRWLPQLFGRLTLIATELVTNRYLPILNPANPIGVCRKLDIRGFVLSSMPVVPVPSATFTYLQYPYRASVLHYSSVVLSSLSRFCICFAFISSHLFRIHLASVSLVITI